MPLIRIYHSGDTVLTTEHRADETYTDGNRLDYRATDDWFEADSADLYDGPIDNDETTLIPFESLRAIGPANGKALGHDVADKDARRLDRKNRTKGQGGTLDDLYAILAGGGTLTPPQLNQMLRLERGL